MTSLKLSILLLFCLLFVLGSQTESVRQPNRNRKVNKDKNVSLTPQAGDDGDHNDDDKDVLVSAGDDHALVKMPRPGRKNKGETMERHGGKRAGGRKRQDGRRGNVKSKRRQLKGKKAKTVVAMGKSINTFSISLYKQMSEAHPDNFVFSPFSVFSAMSMLLLGASGRTKSELTTGLSITSNVHTAIKYYNKTLDQGTDNDTILAQAYNLYYKPGLKLQAPFLKKLQNFYGATPEPFKDTKPEEAINDWVKTKTKGEITDFLTPGSIPRSVQAMLINAVYFKGRWSSKFDDDLTIPLPFFVSPTEIVKTEFMRQSGKFRLSLSDTLGAKILELPYVGDEFALFLILPNTNLSDVESKLTADLLTEGISDTIQTPVEKLPVQMPKFGLDTKEEIKDMLKSIGLTEVFDPSKASFKKLTREKKVSLNEVIHRAVIEVDEEGTVAAAATGIRVLLSGRTTIIIDRPFMFVLRDKVYGINLFIGRYTNPKGANLKD